MLHSQVAEQMNKMLIFHSSRASRNSEAAALVLQVKLWSLRAGDAVVLNGAVPCRRVKQQMCPAALLEGISAALRAHLEGSRP